MRRPVTPPKPPEKTPGGSGETTSRPDAQANSDAPFKDARFSTDPQASTASADTAPTPDAQADAPSSTSTDSGPYTLLDSLGRSGTWAGRWRTLSRLPVTLMISSVLLGLGIVQLTFHIGNSLYRSFTWQQEINQTNARVQNLQRDVNILRDAEKAAQDPAYLEELARCQGFVRTSESVIVSPQASTTPGENCQVIRLP